MTSKHDNLVYRVAQHYMDKGLDVTLFHEYPKGEMDVWVKRNDWSYTYVEVKSKDTEKGWCRAKKQFNHAIKYYNSRNIRCIYVSQNEDNEIIIRGYKNGR